MTDVEIAAVVTFRDLLKQAVSGYNGAMAALGSDGDQASKVAQALASLVGGVAAQLDNVVLSAATDLDAPLDLPTAAQTAQAAPDKAGDDAVADPAPVQQPVPGADPVPAADQPLPDAAGTKTADVAPVPEKDGPAPPDVLIPDPPAAKATEAVDAPSLAPTKD